MHINKNENCVKLLTSRRGMIDLNFANEEFFASRESTDSAALFPVSELFNVESRQMTHQTTYLDELNNILFVSQTRIQQTKLVHRWFSGKQSIVFSVLAGSLRASPPAQLGIHPAEASSGASVLQNTTLFTQKLR